MRGTYSYGRPFKAETPGSDKRYGFCIPPLHPSTTVAVFEAAIDAMAEMTLSDNAADKYRLSLGGIYAPEQENVEIKTPVALVEFLRQHPEVDTIQLCTDNDEPGRNAALGHCPQSRQQVQSIPVPAADRGRGLCRSCQTNQAGQGEPVPGSAWMLCGKRRKQQKQ